MKAFFNGFVEGFFAAVALFISLLMALFPLLILGAALGVIGGTAIWVAKLFI